MLNNTNKQPQSSCSTWLQWFMSRYCTSSNMMKRIEQIVNRHQELKHYHLSKSQWIKNVNPEIVFADASDAIEGASLVGDVRIEFCTCTSKHYQYQVFEFNHHQVIKLACGPNQSEHVLFEKPLCDHVDINLQIGHWYPVLNVDPVQNLICHTRYDSICYGNPYLLMLSDWVNAHDKYIESLCPARIMNPLFNNNRIQSSLIENVSHFEHPYEYVSHIDHETIDRMMEQFPGSECF